MIQFKRNPLFGLCAAFAVAFTLNACGNTQPVPTDEAFLVEITREISIPTTSFVGKVSGTNAFIAIVEREGAVKVYVCDGTGTGVSIAEWFRGTLKGTALTAESENGSKLTGTRNGSSLTGSVTLNGVQRTFSTSETDSSEAGLWVAHTDLLENGEITPRSVLNSTLTGWVVLPDGSQRGAARSNKTGDVPVTQPAPDVREPITNGVGPINTEIRPQFEGSCHALQRVFLSSIKALRDGAGRLTTQQSSELRGVAASVLPIWKDLCEGEFGPIIGSEVPLGS